MANEMQVLGHWEVCDSRFTIYGTIEEPMFLAKEVAERIDHSNPTEMVRNVDADEKLNSTIFSSGQRRKVTFLTEYGLYEVLMQSRKPVARQFKRKVKEILRELRRTGRYDAAKQPGNLPGGCTLDGKPVITVKKAAEHFGVTTKAIFNALYAKSPEKFVKNIDYIPAGKVSPIKIRNQNPGIGIGTNWVVLIRPSGFAKLEARFRRTIGYGAQEALPPPPAKTESIQALPVPAQERTEGQPAGASPQAWVARAKAQMAALSSLVKSYERKGTTASAKEGTAAAMEEAARGILEAAQGMKTAAGEV